MMDYLNLAINDPDTFIEMIKLMPDYVNKKEFNRRRYFAYDGTLVHLIIDGLLNPTNDIFYNDQTAFKILKAMNDNGASVMIENADNMIPYEYFNLFHGSDVLCYNTFELLVKKTTEAIFYDEDRKLYKDYLRGG
jgi:hypothetical protein